MSPGHRSLIYVAHLRAFDYLHELYLPLKESSLSQSYAFILPHEHSDTPYPSKKLFEEKSDRLIIVAEVSYPSTGLGMELGLAIACRIPIIAISRKDVAISRSVLQYATAHIIYTQPAELPGLLLDVLKKM